MNSAFVTPFGVRLCFSTTHLSTRRAPPPSNARAFRAVVAPRAVMSEQHATAAAPQSVVADGTARVQLSSDDAVDVSLSAIQGMDDVDELLALADEFDLRDLRVVDHGVCVEITREGGMGFEDGKLASAPSGAAVQVQDVLASTAQPALQPGAEDGVPHEGHEGDAPTPDVPKGEEATEQKDPDTVYDSDFVVKSNRVGFFFSGAKNKPPLVNVGDHVDFNQPVCIIEQLGQQYVYLSEASGTVLKIFVEDGDAVEYGQHVMVIRPD